MAKKRSCQNQVADSRWRCEPFAAGGSRPRSARPEHHAVLQGVQRPYYGTEGYDHSRVITAYADRSFTFITKTPPAAVLVMKAARWKRFGRTNRTKVGSITMQQVEEIAKLKLPDLNANGLEAAVKSIMGTARSMGIEIK